MSRRRRPSAREARALGRPKGRARLVEVHGNTYEILDLPGGFQKVFRIDLTYIEPDSPEFQLVAGAIEAERQKAEAQERYRQAKARYDAQMAARKDGDPLPPRPVRPHTPGRSR